MANPTKCILKNNSGYNLTIAIADNLQRSKVQDLRMVAIIQQVLFRFNLSCWLALT